MNPLTFEELGSFYLGKSYDLSKGQTTDELLLYDSKDLTTHAVVVGMTGSGKTGLCLSLLEEAGLDRIPSIVIDPKGDISNLLLTFPGLTAEEFRPWVDEGQAAREGMSVEEFARSEARKWKKGLASWGQDGNRIQKLKDSVEMQVFTPGSSSGRPLTVLKSFNAPPPQLVQDPDGFRERIASAASALLALLGIDPDPIRSREHILISRILELEWTAGRDLDLPLLIQKIQQPDFNRVGVIELDSFFPADDRLELAMTLNNLLASPTFSSWLAGEPLDIKSLLHSPQGKPRISVMSIAHLSESQRMFFVTILLNEVLSWMRTQGGTSSLRALLYMDEVFGYFPPSKNPPSKTPMLTLLKQARAYGLGVVLATQNPVDLDYKGLSNTGTWFLGRLQTERDKLRVLEGLEGAAAQTGASFDRGRMEEILAGLGSRVFLMNNVHDDRPVVFHTRWAMSYLRGPLTRSQLQQLIPDPAVDGVSTGATTGAGSATLPAIPRAGALERPAPAALTPGQPLQQSETDGRKLIPGSVEQYYMPITLQPGRNDRVVYRCALFGQGRMHFAKSTYKIDVWMEKGFVYPVRTSEIPVEVWGDAQALDGLPEFDSQPDERGEFAEVPDSMQSSKAFKTWEKELKDYLYRCQNLPVWRCKELKLYSEAGETEGEFRVRLEQAASELRDLEKEKLRKKFASKMETMENRISRAEEKVEVQKSQLSQSRLSSMLSLGTGLLGAVLGRKKLSATNLGRAASGVRSLGRSQREKGDVSRAEESLEDLLEDKASLEQEFETELQQLVEKLQVDSLELEELQITPRKSDLSVERFGVVWMPFRVDSTGIAEPLY